jgi:hypothetical protein
MEDYYFQLHKAPMLSYKSVEAQANKSTDWSIRYVAAKPQVNSF